MRGLLELLASYLCLALAFSKLPLTEAGYPTRVCEACVAAAIARRDLVRSKGEQV
jgi:hypothetical protein